MSIGKWLAETYLGSAVFFTVAVLLGTYLSLMLLTLWLC